MEQKIEQHETQKSWYDKWHLVLLAIPVIILILSLIYLGIFYSKHHDFINKDVSLSGGTTITLNINNIDSSKLESSLKSKFPDVTIRKLTGMESGEQLALIVDSSASSEELKSAIEEALALKLTDENSSTEFTGSTLSSSFYKQLITALIIAFVLMSIVIFILFRTFIPSVAVIFAAFADIIMALAFVNFLGLKISAAGIAAFLMLVGYSVDTDILLTTRALKKAEGKLNERIYGAFKTGILMTITALTAILPAFFIIKGLPDSFKQIFLILAVGLSADIINTWLTNAGIIKIYCDKKGIK